MRYRFLTLTVLGAAVISASSHQDSALARTSFSAGTTQNLASSGNPPTWSPANTYTTGDLVQVNHNVYRAIASPKAGIDPTTNYQYWELANVRYSLTLNIGVGQTFPTLTAAWQYSLNATIGQSALLKMNIVTTGGSYTESPSKPFSLDHPFGSRIAIGGDNPSKVVFDFESSNGFVIDSGHSLASLSGISVQRQAGSSQYAALSASSAATLPSVTNMIFDGSFYTYLLSSSGALMNFVGNNVFHGNDDTMVSANGGTIYLPTMTLNGGLQTLYALYAVNGGAIFLNFNSQIENCFLAGARADYRSLITLDNCTFSGNSLDIQASHESNVSAGHTTPNMLVDSTSHVFT